MGVKPVYEYFSQMERVYHGFKRAPREKRFTLNEGVLENQNNVAAICKKCGVGFPIPAKKANKEVECPCCYHVHKPIISSAKRPKDPRLRDIKKKVKEEEFLFDIHTAEQRLERTRRQK